MEKQNGHVSRERGGGRGAAGSVVQALLWGRAAESRHGQTAWAGVQLRRGLRPAMGPGQWVTLDTEVPSESPRWQGRAPQDEPCLLPRAGLESNTSRRSRAGGLLCIARPFLLVTHLGGNRPQPQELRKAVPSRPHPGPRAH